ncbi:related to glutamyl-tRNA(Gln) amidotransferase subunit A [Melanopsichium pennsylvanicum]|uniref:Glutamyl-tRNA(Gln) amidotransferase subunit A, mitochondrial n=2 Tax=Melanopsichium pennsylvanicum TaxID=63383 RepID=A0AAJ5C7P4_9BASI|nr:related to glutamyl-tRNA(Gln) amidotransferase subunit A [Melanopsichium pennsylvanicum 4]SNX87137.1 related to glutamyl-tRNA(Gln) amidotransferase subunit A [Melanopsichium pennsylvanicum]
MALSITRTHLRRRSLIVDTSNSADIRRCAGSCCSSTVIATLGLRSLATSSPVPNNARTLRNGPFDPYNAIVAELKPLALLPTATMQGRLTGRTAAIKANICVRNTPTTCSSAMLEQFTPTFDAAAVSLLRKAGVNLRYITNCDEFGMGSSNTHSFHGAVRNPASPSPNTAETWNAEVERVAGGSSGGSAAVVAAGLVDIALGSDTGGSVRLPAAYCGVVGLKPSYGMVSRWGLVSYADSLDTVGVLAKTVADAEAVYHVLAQQDSRDPTSASLETRMRATETAQSILSSLPDPTSSQPLKGIRVGVPKEYFPVELHSRVLPPFKRAVAVLEELGAKVVQISLPSTPSALSAYYVISSAEASSNLARYDGVEYGYHKHPVKEHHAYSATRTSGFGEEVRKRILLGTFALTADAFDNFFLQASRIRADIQNDFARALRITNPSNNKESARVGEGVDMIIHPSAVDTAPTLASAMKGEGGAGEYVQDILTVPASLAGLPALAVPAGVAEDDGWPVGVTLVSQWGCDNALLHVGKLMQSQLTV